MEAEGEGEVYGCDFQCGPEVEILNPDHHIATLDQSGSLNMEVTVKRDVATIAPRKIKRKTPLWG